MTRSFHKNLLRTLAVMASVVFLAVPAKAASPVLDSGRKITNEEVYDPTVLYGSDVQDLGNIFETRGIYGKLEGAIPIDIYSFTATEDGEQTFSLMVPTQQANLGQPLLLLIDPTDATADQQLQFPLPGAEGEYHTGVIKTAVDAETTYNEPGLFTKYSVAAEERVKLQKDKKYYLVPLDGSNSGLVSRYVIKIGEGKAWSFGEVFSSLGTWFQVKSDAYAGTSPFGFTLTTFSFLIFILGLMILLGIWVVQETFSLAANVSKPAGYLLIKLQPFSRIFIWISLWFTALGGYMYFHRMSWFGIPFVLFFIFLAIVASTLYTTILVSPKLEQLEVTKREVTIPSELRRPMLINFGIGFVSLLAFVILLGMFLAR